MFVEVITGLLGLDFVIEFGGTVYVFYRLSKFLKSTVNGISAHNPEFGNAVKEFRDKHYVVLCTATICLSACVPVTLLLALLVISTFTGFASKIGNFCNELQVLVSENVGNISNYLQALYQPMSFQQTQMDFQTEPIRVMFLSMGNLRNLKESQMPQTHMQFTFTKCGNYGLTTDQLDNGETICSCDSSDCSNYLKVCACRLSDIVKHLCIDVETCPISHDVLAVTDVVAILPCGHFTKADVMETWLQTNKKCPICRTTQLDYGCIDHAEDTSESNDDLTESSATNDGDSVSTTGNADVIDDLATTKCNAEAIISNLETINVTPIGHENVFTDPAVIDSDVAVVKSDAVA